jgi:hypothetical protein
MKSSTARSPWSCVHAGMEVQNESGNFRDRAAWAPLGGSVRRRTTQRNFSFAEVRVGRAIERGAAATVNAQVIARGVARYIVRVGQDSVVGQAGVKARTRRTPSPNTAPYCEQRTGGSCGLKRPWPAPMFILNRESSPPLDPVSNVTGFNIFSPTPCTPMARTAAIEGAAPGTGGARKVAHP